MGYRTGQEETLKVLDAHLNSRCEDDNCETCPLRLTQITKGINYCYALTIIAEKFFMDNGLRKGEKYYGNYEEKVNKKFNKFLYNIS